MITSAPLARTSVTSALMVLSRNGLQPMSVERLIIQPPLKKNWLSVEDFVATRAAGEKLRANTVTPLELAVSPVMRR